MSNRKIETSEPKISISFGLTQRSSRVELLEFENLSQLVRWMKEHPSTREGGCYITAPMRGGVRRGGNALAMPLICLDFDDLTDITMAALKKAARQLSCLVYETRSSTPQHPRLRVIVQAADPIEHDAYPAAYSALVAKLAALCGRELTVDDSCAKSEQPIFTPVAGAKILHFEGERFSAPEGSPKTETIEPDPIDETKRNVSLASIAGSLRARGCTVEQIYNALKVINEGLERPLPDREVRTISKSYGRYEQGETYSELTINVRDSRKGDAPVKRKELKVPDGLVAEIAAWSAQQSYVVGPQFDLAAGLICTATATCNRYLVQGWRTPLQPYLMVLAASGEGKGSTHHTITEFAKRIRDPNTLPFEDLIFRGFQSPHALFDKLSQEPNIVVWLWDEAARKLKSAARSAGSPDFQIMSHILEMYGTAARRMPALPGRNHTIEAIDNPYLIVLASAQPSQLVEAVTQTDFDTGWVARFLLLDAGDGIAPTHMPEEVTFSSRINKAVRAFRDVHINGSGFAEVGYHQNAIYQRFREYIEETRRKMAEGDLQRTLWTRANQNALIVAGLLAVGQDARKPLINSEICDYAIELSSRSVEDWAKRLSSPEAAGNWHEKLARTIEEFIRSPSQLGARARSNRPKEQALIRQGLVPLYVLKRSIRFNRRRDVDEIVQQLIESNLIVKGTYEGVVCLKWA